jgi:hypothetical protein
LKYNETTNVRDTPTKKKIKLQFHINSWNSIELSKTIT